MTKSRNSIRNPRRDFLYAAACLAAGSVGIPATGKERRVSTRTSAEPGASDGILLRSSGKDLFRVRIELEVEGNVNLAQNALVSRQRAKQIPINCDATIDYEERYRFPDGTQSGEITFVERYYHEANSRSRLNRREQVAVLRQSVRESVVRREMLPEVIYASNDYYHRDELDLLRTPVSSLAVEQLLPSERVRVGSKYSPSREVMVSLLNLTSVEATNVVAELMEITDQHARIQFRGDVSGSIEGVATELRTLGKLTFDRKLGACTWLAIGIHEKRDIGIAEPGFDIAAKLTMLRKPLDQPDVLDPTPSQVDVTGPIPGDRLYVHLVSEELGFSTLTDRRWRMMRDVPGAAMMRMVDTDRVVAQCDIRPLASLPEGRTWTLEDFGQDVERTLGDQLTEFTEAEGFISPTGLQVLRIVAQGAVQGVPIQWVMMHFTSDSGRRLLVSFTMEGDNVELFAGADTQISGTLEFLDNEVAESTPRDSDASPESEDSEVARRNRGENADIKVH